MMAVDSSVAIAAFGEWHELNSVATTVLDQGAAIPAHALLETYSVLTGFPPPHRAAAGLVGEWIVDRFDVVLPAPTASQHQKLVADLAQANLIGRSPFDALIALTAKLNDVILVTADNRATRIYELIGTEYQPLAP